MFTRTRYKYGIHEAGFWRVCMFGFRACLIDTRVESMAFSDRRRRQFRVGPFAFFVHRTRQ